MRNYLIGVVLFAALAATVHAEDAWKEYVHSENLMAFSMPAAPVYKSQSVKTRAGNIVIHSYIMENTSGVLMVVVNVYPSASLKDDPQKLLDRGRDGAVASIHGEVVSQKAISIDGNPGLEFVYNSPKWHGIYRMYLVGTRLYQLGTLVATGATDFPDTGKFLDSFRLVKE